MVFKGWDFETTSCSEEHSQTGAFGTAGQRDRGEWKMLLASMARDVIRTIEECWAEALVCFKFANLIYFMKRDYSQIGNGLQLL